MPKLVILDHSLAQPGGHHYAFASLLSATASEAGWEVILATHRKYSSRSKLAGASRVLPLFTKSTYKGDSLAWGKVTLPVNPYRTVEPAAPALSWRQRWGGFWRRRQQRAYCESLRMGCERLTQAVELSSDDVVFLPTATEFDLVGLSRFWQASELGRRPAWHLWFHYPVLAGRASGSLAEGQRLDATRRHFTELLDPLPDDARIHFHATTQALVEQYEQVAPGRFGYLPYAIPQPLPLTPRKDDPAPLRAVCAGGIRQDKGAGWLAQLVARLWDEFLASGQLQMQIQAKHRKKLPALPPVARELLPSVVHVRHPLPVEAYAQLLQQADCGLFLYTAEQYLNRCSGVLLEMLSSGIPVIVPAGCWLADELAEDTQRHRAQQASAHRLTTATPSWTVWQHERRVTWTTTLMPPTSASAICLEVGTRATLLPGTYLRGELTLPTGEIVADTVNLTRSQGHVFLHLPIAANLSEVRLELSDAYGTQDLALAIAGVHWLSAADQQLPSACVGLVAADREQWPRLVRELIAHYDHYRHTAGSFACEYRQRHSASAFWQNLLSRPRSRRLAA